MSDQLEIEELLSAIDRQQRIAKIEQKIRLYLTPEQLALLDRKLKEIGSIASPASAKEIHDHTDKRREVFRDFMSYVEENLPETTQEQKDTLIFEVGLNDHGVLKRYEEEKFTREQMRKSMKNMLGESRSTVEEYLLEAFQFVCKRETEIAENTVNCSYGVLEDEDGYWHFVYDGEGVLLHYFELENQLRSLFQKRLDALHKVKMGADKVVAEKILAQAGYLPVGELVRDVHFKESTQRYGFLREDSVQQIFIMTYNSKDEIKRKRFIHKHDLEEE